MAMDYHSLELGDSVGELAFGLNLDRNTLPLKDGNDGKGQDKNKSMCVTWESQGIERNAEHFNGWGVSMLVATMMVGWKLKLDFLESSSLSISTGYSGI